MATHPRSRRTVLGLLGLVAAVAISLSVWIAIEHKERRRSADHFDQLAGIHRQLGNPIAAVWNEHKSREYKGSVPRLWWPAPRLSWDPPPDWSPPSDPPGP